MKAASLAKYVVGIFGNKTLSTWIVILSLGLASVDLSAQERAEIVDEYGAIAVHIRSDGSISLGPYGVLLIGDHPKLEQIYHLGNWAEALRASFAHENYKAAIKAALAKYYRSFEVYDAISSSGKINSYFDPPGWWELTPMGPQFSEYFLVTTSGGGSQYNVNLNWQVKTPDDGIINTGNVNIGGSGIRKFGTGLRLTTNVHEIMTGHGTRQISGNIYVDGAFDYNISNGARTYTLGMTGAYGNEANKAGVSLTFDTNSNLLFMTMNAQIPTYFGFVSFRIELPNNGQYTLTTAAALRGSGIIISGNPNGGTVTFEITNTQQFINWIRTRMGLNPI